jgi:hypothetical protein
MDRSDSNRFPATSFLIPENPNLKMFFHGTMVRFSKSPPKQDPLKLDRHSSGAMISGLLEYKKECVNPSPRHFFLTMAVMPRKSRK